MNRSKNWQYHALAKLIQIHTLIIAHTASYGDECWNRLIMKKFKVTEHTTSTLLFDANLLILNGYEYYATVDGALYFKKGKKVHVLKQKREH